MGSPRRPTRRGTMTASLLLLLLLSLAARTVLSSEFIEYYGLLGVDRDVATSDLKRIFRKRSVELHPDKNKSADAVRQFQGLREAFDCISDPSSREYYDTYGENWKEMKEYKEKHLKTMRQQMTRRGHQMYVQHVEVEIEEMFWGDPHVTILHQSFASGVLGGFGGVWVLFFGNPQCGPCRQTAPHVRRFAREHAWDRRDWLRVGTVNMAVGANGNLLNHFGSAARGIPQVILVAPSGGGGGRAPGLQSRLADFEVFDRGDTRDGRAFSIRLLGACERLRASAVPPLPVPAAAATVAAAVGEAQRGAAGHDADPRAKWAVLAVDGSSDAADLLAVYRRLSQKLRHAGFVLRILHCGGGGGEAEGDGGGDNDAVCGEVGSLPELRLYGPNTKKRDLDPRLLLAADPTAILGSAASDAHEYGYGLEQAGFAVFVEAAFLTSTPAAEERFPAAVIVDGASRSTFLNGRFRLIGTTNGRPLYKKTNNGVYMRWLLPGQRSNGEGAWIISDTPEPVDQGWAFLVEDLMVPIGGNGWNLLVRQGRGEFRTEMSMRVSNGEDWATNAGAAIRDEL
mmetsp:Transcript_4849/g.11241  ORF Transcript_4849/g.11241 Transcript_4849/m.11241 type:complete len:568 (-) Transcript_4849:105-1808(-)